MTSRTTLLFCLLIGCGSKEDPPATEVVDSATTDTAMPDTRPRDTGSSMDVGDTAPVSSGTTGKACMTADDCDITGDGINVCAADWFAAGSLYPDPVCFQKECEPPEPGKLASCDQGKGWCIAYSSGATRCYPKCSFEVDKSDPVVGCIGKNACDWEGWTTDDAGKSHGTGICWAGCTADADCKVSGQKCQIEYGQCVFTKKWWMATKKVGDICDVKDRGTDTINPTCSCYYNSKIGHGYCTQFCKMGDVPSTCPTGFTCDAQLPMAGAKVNFTAAAKGLSGACLKNCDTDAECEPLGGFCDERAGTGRKTCQFGVRDGTTTDAGTDAATDATTTDAADAG
jgi:hypothetical protein